MEHPWKLLMETIKDRGWTQKQFSSFVWKKNSEVNELIKWKRNITVQWDLILSKILWTPEKYWINLQVDYDYDLARAKYQEELSKSNQEDPILVWSDGAEISKPTNQENNTENRALPDAQSMKDQWEKGIEQSSNKDNVSDNQTPIQTNLEQEKRKELHKIWRDF